MTSQRRFAVFDIDGTLIRWQLYHAVADALAKEQLIDEATYKQIRQARMAWKRRAHQESFKEYELRLVNAYKAILDTLTTQQFDSAVETVFAEYKDQVYTYTRDLIKSLKKQGYLLLAISNSQQEIVEKITHYYGFDDCIGAIYERIDSHFTGQEEIHLTDKDKVLKTLVSKHNATWQGSIAVGDSGSDISMLSMVEQPIAFNPDKKLYQKAKTEGWKIVIERKNVVYELTKTGQVYSLY